MDPADCERFRKRAIASARSIGLGREAEDIAQEVLLKFVSGKGRHQTIDQAVIDVARKTSGDKRTSTYALRRGVSGEGLRLDELAGFEQPRVHPEFSSDVKWALNLARPKDREILELYFVEGMRQAEIGESLGITESGVSLKISAACGRIRKRIRKEEGGNKMPAEILMERRLCACGCGKDFRVMTSSAQKYATAACELLAGSRGDRPTPNLDALVGAATLAKDLGRHVTQIYLWRRQGAIPSRVVKGKIRFNINDVKRALEKRGDLRSTPGLKTVLRPESDLALPGPEAKRTAARRAQAPSINQIKLHAVNLARDKYREEILRAVEDLSQTGTKDLQLELLKHCLRTEDKFKILMEESEDSDVLGAA